MTQAQNRPTYRVRLRFRLLKKFGIDAPEHRFPVGQREAVLSAAVPDVPIRDSEWLVSTSEGFHSKERNMKFLDKLDPHKLSKSCHQYWRGALIVGVFALAWKALPDAMPTSPN